jgi:hypothetical protein
MGGGYEIAEKANVLSSESRSQTCLDYAESRKTTKFIERFPVMGKTGIETLSCRENGLTSAW